MIPCLAWLEESSGFSRMIAVVSLKLLQMFSFFSLDYPLQTSVA